MTFITVWCFYSLIVGIAADYAGAAKIVQQIAAECYAENGDADLKKYLAERIE